MTISAIFLDIDGTLVSFRTHHVTEATRAALHAARQRGIKVFIATGRPLPFVNNLQGVEYDGLITVNGACCIDHTGATIHSAPIERADLERLINYHRDHPMPLAFASKTDTFITSSSPEAEQVLDALNLDLPRKAPIEECLSMDVLQIIAFFHADLEPFMFSEVFKDCDGQRWHPYFVDVIRKGNNKAGGIDRMLAHYAIPLSETLAFGDGGNDINMLRHVAHGVAMGNAKDAVKANAKYVTDSVDDDGIAHFLNKFVL